MSDAFEWKLSNRQDGFGFYYGEARRGDRRIRVDVLPPAALWDGDIKSHEPDPHAYIVYFDGEEVARVEREADLAQIGQQVCSVICRHGERCWIACGQERCGCWDGKECR